MTVTSPSHRASARRPRHRGGGIPSRIGAIAAAVAITIAPLAAAIAPATAPAAIAADGTPTPSPSPTLSGSVDVTVAPVANGIVRAGDSLTVQVTLHNGTAVPTAPTSVTLSLGTQALADRAAVTSWLAGDGTTAGLQNVGAADLAATATGDSDTNLVIVPAGDPSLAGRAPGVYPLRATFELPGGVRTATSVMIVPNDAASAVPVGVVVPITADPISTGLLSASQLASLTAPAGKLTAELSAVDGTPAILAIDPAIPASIRVLGSSAPASATEWLNRLLALPNSRFALQFGDADVAAQLQSGLSAPMQPTSLQDYMNPDDFPLIPAQQGGSTPTPTPTATPGQPAYPDLTSLLDIGAGRRDEVFWPYTGTAGENVVSALGKLHDGGVRSITLVPSTGVKAGQNGAAVAAHATADGADVLVYDAEVSTELKDAAGQEDATQRGASLAAATAYLSFATRQSSGAPLLVTVDRPAAPTALALRYAITAITQAPQVESERLSELVRTATGSVEVVSGTVPSARVSAVASLAGDERLLTSFSTILSDPEVLTGPERAEILQLLGSGWIGDTGWRSALTQHRTASTKTLAAVQVLPTSSINLFSQGGGLRFWVRNDLPWPVRVTLEAVPDDLRLDVQRSTAVQAEAGGNTRAEVPVRAKIGNGEVTVSLQLYGPSGVPIGSTQSVKVNVRADWEGVGIVVLVVLVLGLLTLGIVRTLLRRRARRGGSAAQDAAEPAVSDAGPGDQG